MVVPGGGVKVNQRENTMGGGISSRVRTAEEGDNAKRCYVQSPLESWGGGRTVLES